MAHHYTMYVLPHYLRSCATADWAQCVDVTLAELDDPDIEEVTPQNCYNSSDLSFELVFTTAALSSGASSVFSSPSIVPFFVSALVTTAMAWL